LGGINEKYFLGESDVKKKLLFLLLVVCIISSLYAPRKAEAFCSCNADRNVVGTRISSWRSDGPYTHYNFWIYDLECTLCGSASFAIGEIFQTLSHNWSSWYDGGHISGTLTHRQNRYCTNNCGETQTRSYSCPGNPCRYPY
jgi:hypothetical protein